ncbi:MAG TPA: hypothetical protein HA347_04270 [Nitrosopumilus sp.]|jgi:hypothetical protein|nr:hypothetical protein [Nitrosopumilus sp.]HIH99116.1 hypothetical protein [Nitrosopumilus sp.]HII05167.1 hypothetical protein [Nitrosopumilus sp.]|tara:strand:+ start:300 stop:461 length:162 start_codon:yes stop_codon:yes gene_type:complete
MGRRKSQKIIRTGPKNATTGLCPLCQTIGKIFLLGSPGNERAKCEKCRQEFEL